MVGGWACGQKQPVQAASRSVTGKKFENRAYPLVVPQRGQLGHGDTAQRNYPSVVTGLAGRKIVTGPLCSLP